MAIQIDGTNGITTPGLENDGVTTVAPGSASAPTITTDGDTNTGLFFPAADTVGLVTGGLERIRADSAGRVTMPYQPAFQVRLSSIQSISANTKTKVAFDTIDYENGNNYNTTNRRFTAPVTGFYQFNVIVYAYTVSGHEVTLWKNGTVYIRSQFENGASVNPTNGILVAATKLTAGDYVEIFSEVNQSGQIYHGGDRPTIWSGYLLG